MIYFTFLTLILTCWIFFATNNVCGSQTIKNKENFFKNFKVDNITKKINICNIFRLNQKNSKQNQNGENDHCESSLKILIKSSTITINYSQEIKGQFFLFDNKTSKQFITFTQTRSRRYNNYKLSFENDFKEYTFTWTPDMTKPFSSDENAICFEYGSSGLSSTQWFSTFFTDDDVSNWPMKSFSFSGVGNSVSIPFTFAKGQKRIKTLAEHLFLNTDGFALLLDDLHPWYFEQAVVDLNESNKAHFCFTLRPSAEPYLGPVVNGKQQEVNHKNKYTTIKLRILMGKDIRAVHQAAVGDAFSYAQRPLTFDQNLFKAVIWNIDNTAVLAQKPIKSNIFLNNFLGDLLTPLIAGKGYKMFHFDQIWHTKEQDDLRFDEHLLLNSSTFISVLNLSDTHLCLTVPPLQTNAVNNYEKNSYYSKINNLSLMGVSSFMLFDQKIDHYFQDEEQFSKYPFLKWTIPLETLYLSAGQHFLITSFVSKSTRLSTPVFLQTEFNLSSRTEAVSTLIGKMLTLSMAGYSLIMPVMNVQSEFILPDYTQMLMFLQVAIFSPGSLYFNVPYWKYLQEQILGINFLRQFHDKHLLPLKMELAEKWLKTGEPILRPMWYAAPNDPVSWKVVDQFMLGPNTVVVPVFKKDFEETRSVYLPPGKWSLYINGLSTKIYYHVSDFMIKENILQNLTSSNVYYLTRVV